MNYSNNFSLKERIKSFTYAFNGIRNLIVLEHNARIHFVALFCVVGLGIIFKLGSAEWIAITIVSGLVILTELINSAVELLADIVKPEWDKKIGLIKDYCAGAVLISAIVSVIVGGLIFIPKILDMIKTFTSNA